MFKYTIKAYNRDSIVAGERDVVNIIVNAPSPELAIDKAMNIDKRQFYIIITIEDLSDMVITKVQTATPPIAIKKRGRPTNKAISDRISLNGITPV